VRGLLIDTNLLVLLVVGGVSPEQIGRYKRTSAYTRADYRLLCEFVAGFKRLVTLPHVLAEVSNLTDMPGEDLGVARRLLAEQIEVMEESAVASRAAAGHASYSRLGLTDAAIVELMKREDCLVLTEDVGLYEALGRAGVQVVNFAHLRAQ